MGLLSNLLWKKEPPIVFPDGQWLRLQINGGWQEAFSIDDGQTLDVAHESRYKHKGMCIGFVRLLFVLIWKPEINVVTGSSRVMFA